MRTTFTFSSFALPLCLFVLLLGLSAIHPGALSRAQDEMTPAQSAAVSFGKKATAKLAHDAFSRTKINKPMTMGQSAIDTPVIVDLNVPFTPEGQLSSDQIQAQRAAISQAQTSLLNSLSTADYDPASVKTYDYVPQLALIVDATALSQLQSSQYVTHVYDDIMVPIATETETLNLIGAPVAWTTYGYRGEGQTIVVLDTGVYKTHDDLVGKVVSEACYSTNLMRPGMTVTSLCPNQAPSSTDAGSGVNCTVNSDCDHGTQVAGIAASASGVAPGANLISIQIYSQVNSASVCGSVNPCIMSNQSDQMSALKYVFSLKDTYSIAAVNLSLSKGLSANCDSTNPLKKWIDQLRSVGIATITASGNDSSHDSLGQPACISSVISVGATENGRAGTVDTIWPQSNSADFLNLLAPGNLINAPIPGGGYADASGTSLAAAHVSGAWAILKQQQPTATVTDILNRLRNNGVNITDPRNNITRSRIKIDAALSCLQTVPSNWRGEYYSTENLDHDATYPNPIMIRDDGAGPALDKNLGDGTLTSSCSAGTNNISMRWTKTVNLPTTTLYAFKVTVDQYARLYVDGVAQTSDWDNISGTKIYPSINLSSGTHTLKLEYKTAVGATQAKLSWIVPPAAPINLAATPSTSSPQITLTWNENDANVSGFKIERSADGGNSYPWSVTIGGGNGAISYVDTSAAYNTTYTYRVSAYNIAGPNPATSNVARTIPAAPTNLVAICPNSLSQINLNWTNNSGADGIKIERSTDGGGSYPWSVTVGGGVNSYVDQGLAAGTTFTYRVTAYNSTGFSGSSNTSSATTLCSYAISPTVAGFQYYGGGGSITVSAPAACSWSAISNANWIHVDSGSSGAGNGSVSYSVESYQVCGSQRESSITVAGQTFQIGQYGNNSQCCIYPQFCLTAQPQPTALDQSATDAGSRGLTARYFGNTTLSGRPALERIDPVVSFNWAGDRPNNLLPADGFSARWNGQLDTPASEAYTFYLYGDGGASLWVNNQLVIDRRQPSSEPETRSAPVELKAGEKADIRLEYYSAGGKAAIHLLWNSASTPKQVIPQRYLYPEAATDKSAPADANKQTGMLLPPGSDAGPKAARAQPGWRLAIPLGRAGLVLLIVCGVSALLFRIDCKESRRTFGHGDRFRWRAKVKAFTAFRSGAGRGLLSR